MATTVTPAISNSIGLAAEYLPLLDEIYKAESKTAVLDTAQDRVRWSQETGSFYLFETDMVALGDYSRPRNLPSLQSCCKDTKELGVRSEELGVILSR